MSNWGSATLKDGSSKTKQKITDCPSITPDKGEELNSLGHSRKHGRVSQLTKREPKMDPVASDIYNRRMQEMNIRIFYEGRDGCTSG